MAKLKEREEDSIRQEEGKRNRKVGDKGYTAETTASYDVGGCTLSEIARSKAGILPRAAAVTRALQS